MARTSRALRGAAWPVPFWRSEGTAHCVVFSASLWQRPTHKQPSELKKNNKQPLIAEDQPRTSDWDGLHMQCSAISGAVRRMASRPLLNVLVSIDGSSLDELRKVIVRDVCRREE